MRGNWDEAEPLAHAPNHHHIHHQQQTQAIQHNQHQQQQILPEEQRHPLHSATTPVWGISDRIVKDEPSEDKTNDSGVSPDHCNSNSGSPRSGRSSSSTANCSLSPGSALSQDSSAMQCGDFDYCSSQQQQMYKDCISPLDYARLDDQRSQQNLDLSKSLQDESSMGLDTLQCPLCPFATMKRLKFSEHLAGHYTSSHLEGSDFVTSMMNPVSTSGSTKRESSNDRSSPMGQELDKSEHEFEDGEEPGLRVPRVNSQGKVKTFRCKQCNFVAITKLEFWEHSRGHIKAEKLLTCPKCPFVTEYKHHLEYHLRNHIGSKPFKCDKCSYSCVNKSMLNSHLKSHSSVYQYRCADCSYATKYCHSLKLHLRKYSHRPAMVLNADGSPNPLPIIDVYGTRRGPKQKPMKNQEDSQNSKPTININNNNNSLPGSLNNTTTMDSQLSPVLHPCLVGTDNSDLNLAKNEQNLMPFFNPMFGAIPLNHFNVEMDKEKTMMDFSSLEKNAEELPRDLALGCLSRMSTSPRPAVEEVSGLGNVQNARSAASSPSPEGINLSTPRSSASTPVQDIESGEKEAVSTPLDLTKPKDVAKVATVSNSPRATGTSRRKGRAVKLERRRLVEEDTDEDIPPETPPAPPEDLPKNKLTCDYCDITYDNTIMYAVHMGFHVNKDPYTCSICGHKCNDNLSFYLHLFKGNHF
ncbi:protein hunchback [Prorops nasuta]|uniref:protein hunchback n=1 Tax=Prorops nasuta TaxID=863751 RepID=UPI0034CEAC3B